MCRCDTDAPAGIAKLEYGTCSELPNTNAENYSTDPNSNSTCVFSLHIYIPNFNSKCQFVMEKMSGN